MRGRIMSKSGALPDWSTVACLGTGWHAAMAVSADGSTWPWLISPDTDADAATTWAIPAHEQLGPLPWGVRHRLTRWLCGHPCKDGHPCRREVHARGRLCPQHLTASQDRRTPDEIRAHADELRAILAEARERREDQGVQLSDDITQLARPKGPGAHRLQEPGAQR